jgi:dTDP-4-amino-4,6-dideoxygalactose transaminase/GT2 family glycosyltransferase
VPTSLGGAPLEHLLDSLASQTVPSRTIVVDNATTDGVTAIVARHDFAECLRLEENVGFGRAVNFAAAQTQDDALVLVNDDCVCEPGFVEQLVAALDPADGVVMAAGVLVEAHDPQTVDTAGMELDETLLVFDYLNGTPVSSIGAETPAPIGPCAAAAAFDRTTFAEAGGFDENLFAYWEDVDLVLRLRRAGGRCTLAAGARGRHEHSATLGSGSAKKNYLVGFGRGYVLRKWSVLKSPVRIAQVLLEDGVICAGQLVLDRTPAGVRGRRDGFAAAANVARQPYPGEVLLAHPPLQDNLARRLRRRGRLGEGRVGAEAAAAVSADSIPVLRPRLPSAERLLPYLRQIDATRMYTSWGPLALELEERLCRQFSVPQGSVVSAGSGTSALTAAILTAAGRAKGARRVAIVPAFTFVATAAAAESCGYTLRLADVDPQNWQLDPKQLATRADLDEVGVVIPVAPFGRPVPQAPWLEFREQTDIPVVIDGAAMFEACSARPEGILGALPVALSFHATKAFATGEGGCVVSTDTAAVEQIGQALNFGFSGSRDSATPSLNGKLSEYHAAVGLAELEEWGAKEAAAARVLELYRESFAALDLADRLVCAPDVASIYVLFQARSESEAKNVAAQLAANDVSYRLWYGAGLQASTYYASCASDPLPVTEELAPRMLGLPFATDLDERAVGRVAAAAGSGVGRP